MIAQELAMNKQIFKMVFRLNLVPSIPAVQPTNSANDDKRNIMYGFKLELIDAIPEIKNHNYHINVKKLNLILLNQNKILPKLTPK